MKLKDIVSDCTIILTGTIIPEKMDMIGRILQHNSVVFNQFKNIVYNVNCIHDSDWDLADDYQSLLTHFLGPNIKIYLLRDFINRGWQFGTMDLEKTAYSFCKLNLHTEWVLKLDFDMLVQKTILDMNVDNGDAFYLPSVGYASIADKKDFADIVVDFETQTLDIINPQTTVYLLRKELDCLYANQEWTNSKYKETILNTTTAIKLGVSCESQLNATFKRNNCRIKCMLSNELFHTLLDTIVEKNIHDPSHKNILFSQIGVCHMLDDKANVIFI